MVTAAASVFSWDADASLTPRVSLVAVLQVPDGARDRIVPGVGVPCLTWLAPMPGGVLSVEGGADNQTRRSGTFAFVPHGQAQAQTQGQAGDASASYLTPMDWAYLLRLAAYDNRGQAAHPGRWAGLGSPLVVVDDRSPVLPLTHQRLRDEELDLVLGDALDPAVRAPTAWATAGTPPLLPAGPPVVPAASATGPASTLVAVPVVVPARVISAHGIDVSPPLRAGAAGHGVHAHVGGVLPTSGMPVGFVAVPRPVVAGDAAVPAWNSPLYSAAIPSDSSLASSVASMTSAGTGSSGTEHRAPATLASLPMTAVGALAGHRDNLVAPLLDDQLALALARAAPDHFRQPDSQDMPSGTAAAAAAAPVSPPPVALEPDSSSVSSSSSKKKKKK